MGRFKVYIKPFDDDGEYQDDWIDVSEDVDAQGLTAIKQSLDNTEYDVGVFKNPGVTLTLINGVGTYSDVGEAGSIFRYRRANSLVKITWQAMHEDVVCGFFQCGMVALSEEVEVFQGLLDDTALKQEAEDQNIQFKVLGRENIFGEVGVPFGSLSNGDTFEEVLYTILNQAAITDLLTVSALNIQCEVDVAIDDVSGFENKTVLEALRMILLLANSVLYVIDGVVYVTGRAESVDLQHTFYGQGATEGMESIIDISEFRAGLNRTFNYWTWEDTALLSQNVSSVDSRGIKKKELSSELVTNNTNRQTILDSLRDEFSEPKREFTLRCPIDYNTIELNVLDKVAVDYPNVGISDDAAIPKYDNAVYDEAKYPNEVLPITIESTATFKILSRDIDPANQELVLLLRET